ncbi:MAG: iron-containing alcohol dehydrogenase [Planctomycetota bacterium]
MTAPAGFQDDEKTRVVEGAGALAQLGVHARALGGARVFLVSDPGVVRAGHGPRAAALLRAAGLTVQEFSEVGENPSTEDVARGLERARAFRPDLFVAVGGGSPIDAAKGVNFLLVCGGAMRDYWGHDKATKPLLPLIAVPTTAGTGSEVQSFALISDAETHRKMACGDPSAAPRIALLDPELTLSMPPFVTACTGLDTLAHAVESAVSRPRNERSRAYSRAAFSAAYAALPRVLADPRDLDARAAMLRAAALAGLAIEHSMLGAAHSMANPLTAHHGVPHGQAVGTLLPHVVRFNALDEGARGEYLELARLADLAGSSDPVAALADGLGALVSRAGLPAGLAALGVAAADVPRLAAESAQQWTAGFNPRSVVGADFEVLLLAAL